MVDSFCFLSLGLFICLKVTELKNMIKHSFAIPNTHVCMRAHTEREKERDATKKVFVGKSGFI